MKKVMSESTYDNKLRPQYYENNYANMAAAFIVETERWDLEVSSLLKVKLRRPRLNRRPWEEIMVATLPRPLQVTLRLQPCAPQMQA